MSLDDLSEAIEKHEITDADIEAMEERLNAAVEQFEQEAKDKTPTWEWYHQIVNI